MLHGWVAALLLRCCCSKVLAAIGKEVKEFYGGNHSQAALTQTTGVIVCTIEKANIMCGWKMESLGGIVMWRQHRLAALMTLGLCSRPVLWAQAAHAWQPCPYPP